MSKPPTVGGKALTVLGLVLVVALLGHLAVAWLGPLVPALLVIFVLVALLRLFLAWRR